MWNKLAVLYSDTHLLKTFNAGGMIAFLNTESVLEIRGFDSQPADMRAGNRFGGDRKILLYSAMVPILGAIC